MEEQNKTDLISNNNSILIVDDVAENLRVLGYLLKGNGYRVAVAGDGNTAINTAVSKPPDIILLDVSMPDMDGFAVCSVLKNNEITREIPVIFLTARTEITDLTRGFELGAVDYITKPFNQAELLSRVKTHLELRNAKETILRKNTELDKKNRELIQLNKSKDKFFSIIAHDLKNPFNTLIGFTEFLAQDLDKLNKSDILEIVVGLNNSANKLFELLNNLLEWSRIQTGGINMYLQDCLPGEIVEEDIAILLQPAKNKNLSVIREIRNDVRIQADRNMFRSVIQNLLYNAIKFSYSGNVILIYGDVYNGMYVFTVEDNGVGIEEEYIGELFKPEYKYSTPGTADEEGTGLGLILCKELVEKMGGWISVESTPGKGSKFRFAVRLSE